MAPLAMLPGGLSPASRAGARRRRRGRSTVRDLLEGLVDLLLHDLEPGAGARLPATTSGKTAISGRRSVSQPKPRTAPTHRELREAQPRRAG
jgi:hypothetical protein